MSTLTTYCMYAPIANVVKIGSTRSIEDRAKTIQAMSPEILEVEPLEYSDGFRLEAELHSLLRDSNHHGEWFSITDSVVRELANVGALNTILAIKKMPVTISRREEIRLTALAATRKYKGDDIEFFADCLKIRLEGDQR